MRRLLRYITRPKITIYLKSGNVVRTRMFPFPSYDSSCFNTLIESQYGDIIRQDDREALVYRKWWQKWG